MLASVKGRMKGAVPQQVQMARMSKRDTALLDKLSKMDDGGHLTPPDYAEIIRENELMKEMAKKVDALMQFKDVDFQEYRKSGVDTLEEMKEQIEDLDARLDRAQEDLSAEMRHLVQEQARKGDVLLEKNMQDTHSAISDAKLEVEKQIAQQQRRQTKCNSDLQLALTGLRKELGFGSKDMPQKLSLYSVYRVQEMIL